MNPANPVSEISRGRLCYKPHSGTYHTLDGAIVGKRFDSFAGTEYEDDYRAIQEELHTIAFKRRLHKPNGDDELAIELPEEQYEAIRLKAEARGMTVEELIREVLSAQIMEQ